ncbi:Putative transposable element [Caligus rogercresseyi]|uniref:Transposable element n=1 Tax=Caligus rogercresseyi TaxID=217165 RepID=A0A7T8HGG6_CALRO|nr:Putative transposable element [Caligus rogercresseyi]
MGPLPTPARPSRSTSRTNWDPRESGPNKCGLLISEPEPLGFSIWQHIENMACGVYHSNISDLKATVNDVWAAMDETYIRKSCSDFRKRLNLCIDAEGSIFEK